MPLHLSSSRKQILYQGLALAGALFVLRWIELRFLIFNYSLEVYIGLIALLFTGLGIWLALKLSSPKVQEVLIEKEVPVPQHVFQINKQALDKIGLSSRELEVLDLMAKGYSNQEIAERLFLSLNTIKTHSSNLYVKLDVKRRTQAIEKAKRLNIIA